MLCSVVLTRQRFKDNILVSLSPKMQIDFKNRQTCIMFVAMYYYVCSKDSVNSYLIIKGLMLRKIKIDGSGRESWCWTNLTISRDNYPSLPVLLPMPATFHPLCHGNLGKFRSIGKVLSMFLKWQTRRSTICLGGGGIGDILVSVWWMSLRKLLLC